MRLATSVYRLGILGILLTGTVFLTGPLHESLVRDPAVMGNLVLLYGYPVLAGIVLLPFGAPGLRHLRPAGAWMIHGLALLAVLWLWLWCFFWLAVAGTMGDQAEMVVKHLGYLHLFGVGFTMAGYFTGWMTPHPGERAARFLMGIGWAVSYMAWINLYLQSGLVNLWPPAVGGLLAVLGAFLIHRTLKAKVEAVSSGA